MTLMADDKQKQKVDSKDESDHVDASAASTYDTVDTSSDASEFADNLPAEAGEKSKEDKVVASSGKSGAKDDVTKVPELKPIQFPSPRIMKMNVENALSHEKAHLISDVEKYDRKGDFFELNKAVAKVREISQTIVDLALMTYDALKGLWMKYVYKE